MGSHKDSQRRVASRIRAALKRRLGIRTTSSLVAALRRRIAAMQVVKS